MRDWKSSKTKEASSSLHTLPAADSLSKVSLKSKNTNGPNALVT